MIYLSSCWWFKIGLWLNLVDVWYIRYNFKWCGKLLLEIIAYRLFWCAVIGIEDKFCVKSLWSKKDRVINKVIKLVVNVCYVF